MKFKSDKQRMKVMSVLNEGNSGTGKKNKGIDDTCKIDKYVNILDDIKEEVSNKLGYDVSPLLHKLDETELRDVIQTNLDDRVFTKDEVNIAKKAIDKINILIKSKHRVKVMWYQVSDNNGYITGENNLPLRFSTHSDVSVWILRNSIKYEGLRSVPIIRKKRNHDQ